MASEQEKSKDELSPLWDEAVAESPVTPPVAPAPKRRASGVDLLVALLSLVGLILGIFIWYQPPLVEISSPTVECRYLGEPIKDVKLYTPLSMPARYYVKLPRELRKRYQWFSVDLRREICAISEPPTHTFLGWHAVRRSEPLGLDLEFRHLDDSEWHINFSDERIAFTNAVLSVELKNR